MGVGQECLQIMWDRMELGQGGVSVEPVQAMSTVTYTYVSSKNYIQTHICLRMRGAAVMLRSCYECFHCASAGADIVPDATVCALTDRNNQ